MTEIYATQKFLLTSPKKIRPVVDVVKKMNPKEAVEKLPFVGKEGAGSLAKVIKTAIANAKDMGISESDLIFKEIQINQGPALKRGQPVSRGQWHQIKRRMSHIRVVLTTKTQKPDEKGPKTEITKKKGEKKNGTKS